jgi:two-component system phosphate regulon response regulator PhoB
MLVWVVDDDVSVRLLLSHILTDAGHRVVCADSGDEALRLLDRATPDLMIVDLLMPGTTGWDLLDFMREHPRLSSVPVIVLTAFGEDGEMPLGRAVIHKPIDDDLLCGLVAELLSQKLAAPSSPCPA